MLRKSASALAVATLLLGMPCLVQAQAPVGVAGAVNPRTDSTPPGGQTRTVMVGAQMVMNEKVATGPQGSTQLVFTDHSTLTIGPNSEVTIDQFVYDANANSGKMAVSLGKGVMRFVGGELSHQGNATITTPSATVGIRGGIVMLRVAGQETAVINLFGKSDITSTNCKAGVCTVSILRPGFGTIVNGSAPPASPFVVPSDQMVTLTVQLQSSPGQTGGSTNPPSDGTTQANGTGQSSSGLVAANTQPQAPQGGGPTPPGGSSQDLGGTPGLYGSDTTTVGDISRQQQNASGAGVEPTNFPDGTTSIGDLRTVTAPRVFTYSQTNVPIYYFNGVTPQQVGSYNFDMTINLGAPASRSLTATASNINASGVNWPLAPVTNSSLSFSLPAPDFQFAGSPVTGAASGFGVSTTCASGVDCAMGFAMRNSGGRVAAFADHNVVLYPTPGACDPTCAGPPPVGTVGTAGGSGTAARDLGGPGGPVTTLGLTGKKFK